ncbi:MAG: cell division/cell wall cluster transcriptional repressor MraZ [Myxococcales bacterium]|nr:MAG: cell division/cell wall cluster transcriptional repressor MraZ [Myxococcales bacterium]
MNESSAKPPLPVFRGMHGKQIDAKNRIGIPGPFRALLPAEAPETVILAIGIDPSAEYLEAWTAAGWERVLEDVARLADPIERRAMERGYVAQAVECKLDGQGRIVIPPYYRQWAGLDADVLWIGGGNLMELWAKSRYEAQQRTLRQNAFQVYLNNRGHFRG